MGIRIRDIADALEEIAPLSWQEDYDNAGLILGNPEAECTGVYVCLDVFPSEIEKAIKLHCNMVVSHHPCIFSGIKKIVHGSDIEKILSLSLQNDIAIYATHTNMDSAATGVNFMLAKALGLKNIQRLSCGKDVREDCLGEGAICFTEKPLSAEEFVLSAKRKLNLGAVRYFGDKGKTVSKIAICGGSGAFLVREAIRQNCDIMLTGDVKYHDFLACEDRIILADIGHFESEQFIKQRIVEIISKKFTNFANCFLSEEENRVKFL